ncbi:MAG: Rab family GTPase [Promethearchaeota archaeon]
MADITDIVYKIIIVGDAEVGKTALARRFTMDQFDESYLFTLGVDFFAKEIKVKGNRVKIVIYDTAGQEKFDFIRGLYFEGAAGAVVAYDITNRQSFKRVGHWVQQVLQHCKGIPIELVATKLDLEDQRTVTIKEGEKQAKQNKMIFIESSSKENVNVNDVFQRLAEQIWKQYEKMASSHSDE